MNCISVLSNNARGKYKHVVLQSCIMETGDGNFHTNYVSLQRNQWKSKKNRTIERTFNVRARFVFVVLNGVYSGRKRSIGGASRPRRSRAEREARGRSGIRGRRRADKAAWSIRSAPIVDHFEGSVFERNPRKWFFSRGLPCLA